MNFKEVIQDYFTFSRNERKGITILLVVIFMLAVANKFIFYFETPATIDSELLYSPLEQDSNLTNRPVTVLSKQTSLFSFDPNAITPEGLDSLFL